MFRLLSLHFRTRLLCPRILAGAALLLVCWTLRSPQEILAESVLEDPALRDYRAIDLGAFETPAPTRQQPVPPPPTLELPGEISETAPLPGSEAAPSPPKQLPLLRQAEPVERVDQIPLCAVIDLDSDTLDVELVSAVTTQVWNETRRAGQSRLLRLADSRHILTAYNLIPTDPYRPPPTRRQMAQALEADYLILGNVNNFEGTYALDLQLYSADSDRVIRSVNALSPLGFKDLLKEIPDLAVRLLELVPLKVVSSVAPAAPGQPTAGTPREKLLENEIVALRLENERLQKKLQELGRGGAPQAVPLEFPAARTAAPEETPSSVSKPLPPLAPVRHGNKLPGAPKIPLIPSESLPPAPEEPAAGISPDVAPPSRETLEPPPPEPEAMPQPQPEEKPPALEPASEPTLEPTPEPAPEPAPTPAPFQANVSAAPSPDDKDKARQFYQKSLESPASSREGLEPLEKALELDPGNVEYQRALVERLYRTGLFADCARRGKGFVNRGANDATINIYVGAAFTELADYKEALEATDRVLKIEPNNGYALYNRALNLYKLSDKESAPAFRTFLERFGENPAFAKYADSARACLKKLEPKGE